MKYLIGDTMISNKLNYVVFKEEENVFVARCLDVEVTSDGPSEQEAIAALKEALELYFEDHETALENLPLRAYQVGEVVIYA